MLKTFQKTCVEFIKLVGKKKGMTDKQVKDLGGKVATFGSFRLGVFGPGQSKSEVHFTKSQSTNIRLHQVPILTLWSSLRSM